MHHVPATTAVKRNRAANVDTDRLVARRNFLLFVFDHAMRDFNGTRAEFGFRVAELGAIEQVLIDRNVLLPSDRRVRL